MKPFSLNWIQCANSATLFDQAHRALLLCAFFGKETMQDILKKGLTNFEVLLSGLFLSVTVVVVIINVILRYLFQGGLFWVEEVATTSFIWSIFIGAAAAYKNKMHIGIDMITMLFPERARELISMIINLLMVVINGYIVYLSTLFIRANSLKRTPVLDIPALYVNLAITVGFGLVTIHAVQFLFKEARQFFGSNKQVQQKSLSRQ